MRYLAQLHIPVKNLEPGVGECQNTALINSSYSSAVSFPDWTIDKSTLVDEIAFLDGFESGGLCSCSKTKVNTTRVTSITRE